MQVLGLAEGAATEEVRRAFRRGAARVHPDKCRLPRAEAAFKLLAAAAEQAMAAGRCGAQIPQPHAVPSDMAVIGHCFRNAERKMRCCSAALGSAWQMT